MKYCDMYAWLTLYMPRSRCVCELFSKPGYSNICRLKVRLHDFRVKIK